MGSCQRPVDFVQDSRTTPPTISVQDTHQPDSAGEGLPTALSSPVPSLYHPDLVSCQEDSASRRPSEALRIALIEGAVSLSDQLLHYLCEHRIETDFVGSAEEVLRRLDLSLGTWPIVVYPIWSQFQRALEFARGMRRTRERNGAPPDPRALILSFVEHPPTTIQWFKRTHGAQYSVFSSEENLVHALWTMHQEIVDTRRTCRLHLRFVHSGNPSGVGCISGERLVAAYGSFIMGEEREIGAQMSVLRFLNLLATSRWRFRSARELVDLIARDPLYRGSVVPSLGSIKTYIARADEAFNKLWRESGHCDEPPIAIARQCRGKKEVAYRLLCSAELEHI